jgi:hypothetical protein
LVDAASTAIWITLAICGVALAAVYLSLELLKSQ